MFILTVVLANTHCSRYDASFGVLGQKLVGATASLYAMVLQKLLPTPAKSHYLFNLRDFSRVMQGVMLVPPKCLTEAPQAMRLWVHEVSLSCTHW